MLLERLLTLLGNERIANMEVEIIEHHKKYAHWVWARAPFWPRPNVAQDPLGPHPILVSGFI